MSISANLTTIHPYFRLQPGREAEAEAIMEEFLEATRTEPDCLFYGFSRLNDEVFCREGYEGGEGVLRHLQNVGPILEKMLGVSELTRLEFHGPAAEIDKLREPLAELDPCFFVISKEI